MKVVIAGGGTGGHLFPGLAVAERLQERGHEVIILISEKEIDALATRDRNEFRFEKIPSMGMPKLFSPAIIRFLGKFRTGLRMCKTLYKEFQPDAVLGMGGFTSTAPILAGRMSGIPTFVHESNAIPGKANRLNARLVEGVLLGFEECKRYFPGEKCVVTGTPLRKALATRIDPCEALSHFGLAEGRKTILVMGGSQGAHGINTAVVQAMPLLKEEFQVIHLTGAQDESMVATNYRRDGVTAHVAAFCNRMEAAYSAADIIVARSGAASLTEISYFAIPSILVPYPYAAENHQTLNAEIFAREGAAAVIKEPDATAERLASTIRELIEPETGKKMSEKARILAPNDAADRIVEIIEKTKR